jgi:sugar lactone lactonase YvrE
VRLTNGRASAIAAGPGLEHVTRANESLYGTGSDGVVYRVDGSSLTPITPALDASSAAVDAAGNIYVSVYAGWIKRITPGGAVTTIAGNGTEGSTGDGGPAAAALLFHPHAIVLSGNAIYVSDTENRRLRRIDLASGIIRTFGGDVGVTVALAIGPDGSLYSADVIRAGVGGGITRTTPDGVTTRLLNGVDVNGIAVTPNGAVYANLWNEKRIQQFNPSTKRLDPVARG